MRIRSLSLLRGRENEKKKKKKNCFDRGTKRREIAQRCVFANEMLDILEFCMIWNFHSIYNFFFNMPMGSLWIYRRFPQLWSFFSQFLHKNWFSQPPFYHSSQIEGRLQRFKYFKQNFTPTDFLYEHFNWFADKNKMTKVGGPCSPNFGQCSFFVINNVKLWFNRILASKLE